MATDDYFSRGLLSHIEQYETGETLIYESTNDNNGEITNISWKTLHASIKAHHICCVDGYIRKNSAKNGMMLSMLSQNVADLILFFYAKPIVMKTRYINALLDVESIKYILYSPLDDNWDMLCNKLLKKYKMSNDYKVSRLMYENRNIKKYKWNTFRWNEKNTFTVQFDREYTMYDHDLILEEMNDYSKSSQKGPCDRTLSCCQKIGWWMSCCNFHYGCVTPSMGCVMACCGKQCPECCHETYFGLICCPCFVCVSCCADGIRDCCENKCGRV
eukprot:220661_1